MELSTTPQPTVADLSGLLAEFSGQAPEAAACGLVSLLPTRHVVALPSGSRLYTYCALDTLLIPHLLGEDAELESLSPGAAKPLHYRIAAGQLQAPPEWVLSFPSIQLGGAAGAFKGSFCPYANLFVTAQAYANWAAHEQVSTRPISFLAADDLARRYAQQLSAAAPAVCGCGCGLF